jgi:hypothetical protein
VTDNAIKLALQKIEAVNADGATTLTISAAPYVRMRWSDLDAELGPDASGWSFWCPRCQQCPMWVTDALGLAAEKGVKTIACWSQCHECKLWVLLEDEEIRGARVLTPEECDVARVMET